MGAEIFDVEVNIDGVLILYATKIGSKKNKNNSITTTFNGDVTTSVKNTGGTISIEGLVWPTSVEDAILLEEKLESSDIKVITCKGNSYTAAGDLYTRSIIGSQVTVTSDEEDWAPTDGISQKLEFAVDNLIRKSE